MELYAWILRVRMFRDLRRYCVLTKPVTLKDIVNVAGPEMSDINAVATLLGQRSTRHTQTTVDMWKTRL